MFLFKASPILNFLRLEPMFNKIDGPGDNLHSTNTRVLPALIRSFREAAEAGAPSAACWRTGTPLRKFPHVDDLGEVCFIALEHWQPGPEELQFLNLGTGGDLTIRDLAEAVAQATGIRDDIYWDANQPDGTPKKPVLRGGLRMKGENTSGRGHGGHLQRTGHGQSEGISYESRTNLKHLSSMMDINCLNQREIPSPPPNQLVSAGSPQSRTYPNKPMDIQT
jgi:hypothetical protein